MDRKKILEALLVAVLSVFTSSCNTELNLDLEVNYTSQTVYVCDADKFLDTKPIDL